MSEQLFSEAMGKLSDKYISEAINYKGKKKEQNIILWVKRSVVAATIILAVGFGVLMVGDTEVRATVWRWVKEVYSGEWHKFSMETDVKEAANLKYELGWIPEGMEFVTKFDIMGGESFIYTDEKELVIVFSYSTDPEYVFYMDSVDNIKEEVTINGMPGEIFIIPSEEETNTIVWGDASIPVMFSFTAECDNETMIKVAENIKVIEVEDEE